MVKGKVIFNCNKFILDVTAGYRVMWKNKNHPCAIYLDQKPECNPDVVTSYTDLSMIPSLSMKLVVFDPPHMIYYTDKSRSFLEEKYGILEPDWEERITKAIHEMWRVLDIFGVLVFKWNNNHIREEKLLKLFPIEPLFGQVVGGSKGLRNYKLCEKCYVCEHPCPKGNNARSQTFYYVFMKIPNGE